MSNPAETTASPQNTASTIKKFLKEQILPLVYILLIVLAVRSSIFESFKIPTGSMIPTLAIGDYIMVNRLAYGLKVPFADWFTSDPPYIARWSNPQRGEIVVFRYPRDESIYFIKRVVGIPGDTVEVREKALYINGKQVSKKPLEAAQVKDVVDGGALMDPQYPIDDPDLYYEQLGDSNHLMMLDRRNTREESTNFGPTKIPEGMYFAMGDNRDGSNDSRFWGFVPLRNVAGRASFIWLSFWTNFSDRLVFHPGRIGTRLN